VEPELGRIKVIKAGANPHGTDLKLYGGDIDKTEKRAAFNIPFSKY
jgi:hypothetical protein